MHQGEWHERSQLVQGRDVARALYIEAQWSLAMFAGAVALLETMEREVRPADRLPALAADTFGSQPCRRQRQ